MVGTRMLICGKASPPVALAAGSRTSRAVRSTLAVARVAQRRRLSVALPVPVLSAHPLGPTATWGGRISSPTGRGSLDHRGDVSVEGRRADSEAVVEGQAAVQEAEAAARKAERKAKKAEKKAKKMKEMAGMADSNGSNEDRDGGRRLSKKEEEAMEASGSGVDKALEVGVISAMREVVQLQAEGHARQVAAWEEERKAFQEREAQLMGLVDTLSQRLVSLAAPPSSSPSAAVAAPQTSASTATSVSPPSTANATTQTPPDPFSIPSNPKPAAVLGGDGVYDILNVINDHNRRFSANVTGSSDDEQDLRGLWRDEEEANAEQVEGRVQGGEAGEMAMGGREEALRERAEELLAAASPAEEASPGQMEEEAVEPSPSEEPIDLKLWDDDIYWVNQLQAALLREGLYCGEEEMEEWYFGHHTENALLTWQAMRGLPETGVCDKACWEALLGPGFRRVTVEEMPEAVQDSASASEAQEPENSGGDKDVFAFLSEAKQKAKNSGSTAVGSDPNGAPPSDHLSEEEVVFSKWPLLRLDEGGAAVHHAQVALEGSGFAVDEDEARWWMYGDSTQTAVATFQACNGMADTGMVDEHTWKALLGNPDAVPNDITGLKSFNSYDEDLSGGDSGSGSGGGVWLLGEQRWSTQ